MPEANSEAVEDWRIEASPVTVLFGVRRGKYPQGNTLLVEGARESVLIDPSLGLLERRERLPRVDRVLHSHCHEDHIAGSHLYTEVPWHFHEADAPGIRSLDAMMGIYGFPDEIDSAFRSAIEKQFHFVACAEPLAYRDGDVFDLGDVRIEVVHTPGHTRGHCCLHVRWADDDGGVLYLGDIDLSSFGPYYGDAWSDLEDFERSLERIRAVEARHYATFHHIGVVDRATFLERLDHFAAVIDSRESRLLEYLREPRSLDEVAEHRFVYRPKDPVSFAFGVERRSMGMHVERLLRAGRVKEVEPGRFATVD